MTFTHLKPDLLSAHLLYMTFLIRCWFFKFLDCFLSLLTDLGRPSGIQNVTIFVKAI